MKLLRFILFMAACTLFADIGESPQSFFDVELTADAEQDKEPAHQKETPLPQNEDEEKPQMPSEMHKATESYETAFIKTIVVLVGLLVLVILTVWMFKKISHGRIRGLNYMKSVKILEKRPLSPKSMLYLVEVSGKQVLIAESQLEVRNVATVDWLEGDKDL